MFVPKHSLIYEKLFSCCSTIYNSQTLANSLKVKGYLDEAKPKQV